MNDSGIVACVSCNYDCSQALKCCMDVHVEQAQRHRLLSHEPDSVALVTRNRVLTLVVIRALNSPRPTCVNEGESAVRTF